MRIADGTLTGLFSFDVGYEIALDLLPAALQPLGMQRTAAAPAGIRAAGRVIDLSAGVRAIALPSGAIDVPATIRVHDFGVLTVMLQLPLSAALDELGPLTAALARTKGMENVAIELAREVLRAAGATVSRPNFSAFSEDFYVIHVTRFAESVTPDDLRTTYRAPIALALRCEKEHLAEGEAEEVFESAISYHPQDLLVTDWNATFVYGPPHPGVLDALEFLNVQLVELRFFDDRLDRRMSDLLHVVYSRPQWRTLVVNPFTRALQEVSELKVETSLIFERVSNALKFIDDLYLARVYAAAAARLRLDAWRSSVESKLRVVHEIFEILNGRAATYRAEALELIIIVLIAAEILLGIFR